MKKITLSLTIAATLASSPSWSFFEVVEPGAGAQPGSAHSSSHSPGMEEMEEWVRGVLLDRRQEWVRLDHRPHVKEVGEGWAEVVKGFGRRQPLSEALRLIAPKGWKGYAHRDVGARDLRVDWRGGKPWTEILESIGEQEGLNFEVDWRAHKVMVTRAPQGSLRRQDDFGISGRFEIMDER